VVVASRTSSVERQRLPDSSQSRWSIRSSACRFNCSGNCRFLEGTSQRLLLLPGFEDRHDALRLDLQTRVTGLGDNRFKFGGG